MRRISLKVQLGLGLVLLLAMTTWLLSVLVMEGIERQKLDELEQDLLQHSEIANLRVRQTYLLGERMEDQTFLRLHGQELANGVGMLIGLPVVIYNLEGEPVGNSLFQVNDTDIGEALGYALSGRIAYQSSAEAIDYLAPLTGSAGQMGVVQFHYSLTDQHQFQQRIERLFLLTGAAVTLGGLLVGYLFFNRLAARIYRLRDAAGEIRRRRFLKRMPVNGRDELSELGESIFHMSREIEQNIRVMEDEQRKLRLAVAKLQSLEQQQKQFIGNISHEFKTPLTSIKAYVDLMGMYDDDPELIRQAHAQIGQEAQRLQEMVEKVLHLSALERYEFEQEQEALDMSELLAELCLRMTGKAQRHGLTIRERLSPAVIWADRESIIQIFINLLDNAVKYNVPGGSITVECGQEEGMAVIRVRDTGIGIPPDARERIFDPFYTVNKDRSRQSGGSGLGLALVSQVIKKLQGELDVMAGDGTPEQPGSVFIVRLPLHQMLDEPPREEGSDEERH
ncbi:sensor histidine kinase [Paenibacillus sp. 1P07SE]|uniref:sensor histidine kinase n=1 Tax=Paenibacillus sp. 1P07SE TaxID=3132209 RepID=UPI0039A61058